MTVFTGIVLYLLIFWVALFAVLPFWHKQENDVQEGNVHSAPVNPHMGKKFIATGIVAAVLWLCVFAAIKADLIDFYTIARTMSEEDGLK